MSETVVGVFRVKRGEESKLEDLLARHWPTLKKAGLVTDSSPYYFRGQERDGSPIFIEVFEWKDSESSGRAHGNQSIQAIWGPMDQLTEDRGGRPNMEFHHVARFTPALSS